MNALPSQTAGIQSSLADGWRIAKIQHRDASRPGLFFACDPKFTQRFRLLPGRKYSKSLSTVFKSALDKADLAQNYTLHSLRHRFATHLYEQEVDLLKIQRHLGHAEFRGDFDLYAPEQSGQPQITSALDGLQIPQKRSQEGVN